MQKIEHAKPNLNRCATAHLHNRQKEWRPWGGSCHENREEKTILRVRTFLLCLPARLECYQLLLFPDNTFFAVCWNVTNRVLLHCFLQFRGTVAALHHILFELVHGAYFIWSNERFSTITKKESRNGTNELTSSTAPAIWYKSTQNSFKKCLQPSCVTWR